MIRLTFLNRLTPRKSVTLSVGLLAGSASLLWMHAVSVRDMREVGLPAALALPQIEERMEMLKEQNEVAQLHAAIGGGSAAEMLRMYVLPGDDSIDRLLSTIDALMGDVENARQAYSFGAVNVGERTNVQEGLVALPVTFDADLSQEGMDRLLELIGISGLLTVSDALTPDDTQKLIALTERENPAAIAALEAFLATDLLRYSEDPLAFEEQLKKSFVSDYAQQSLQSVLASGRLRRARELLAGLSPELRARELWPLRLLTLEKTTASVLPNGRVHASFTLRAYVRTK